MKGFICPVCGERVMKLISGPRSERMVCEKCYQELDFPKEKAPGMFVRWKYDEARRKTWEGKKRANRPAKNE